MTIINALEGLTLPVYGKGANVRDWLYVDDHARALVAVLTRGAVGHTYCVGGRCERANLDVVKAICALMDEFAPNSRIGAREGLITFVADRPGHDLRYAIDASKIAAELGWEPQETFETGLRKTVEWYLANRSWWGAHPQRRLSRRAAGSGRVILVFGRGQLGAELDRAAASRHVALTALAHDEADIADAVAVERAIAHHRPYLVVNAAAYTKVDLAETETEAARRGNEIGPGVIARACAAAAVPLIHISTDYVFDGTKLGAYLESDPIAPLGAYGRSKAAGETAVRGVLQDHVMLRTSWVYGEFGHNFLKTMLRLAASRDELRVVADQRGCPTSTRDLADAILKIAPRLTAREAVWGTYHFAGTGATTWHGFASRIVAAQASLTGRRPPVIPITTAEFPTPARRPANSELDSSLFARTFGFRARPWEEEADAITRALVAATAGTASHVA